jgi:hypothetical protein
MGIGPSGLLVEENQPGSNASLGYNNLLGAGTGTVGLPMPSSALNTSSVIGAQYLGFIFDAGHFFGTTVIEGNATHLASFGFSSSPASTPACSSFIAQTGTLSNGIYGGDFKNDDPSTSSTGFGNCDFAIDLGTTQSPAGLYPNVTVWIGSSYAANASGKTYSFPAVAITGQLDGKYALFVLGVDSTQPWGIYLLQSNWSTRPYKTSYLQDNQNELGEGWSTGC